MSKLLMRQTMLRRVLFAAILLVLLSGTLFAQRPHTLTGDIRVYKDFHSQILNNNRDLIIYLPPGYSAHNKERYSVLYLNDGQNLFDGATSFIPGQEWRADETAQALITARKIEPLIIVGIYNTGKDRINEYTPEQDAKYKAGGQADLYGRMLVEELKPFIDRTFRTKRDSNHTGLGGSSLGGIVSLYLGLKYKSVFGRLAVISPSVWFANNQILRYTESLTTRPRIRIWLDIGTREGGNAEEWNQTVSNTRLLRDALESKGWKLGKDLEYLEDSGAEHNERAWAGRLEAILIYLFGRTH